MASKNFTLMIVPEGVQARVRRLQIPKKGVWALGLVALVKTSGSKGLQLFVPLNTPATYAQTKPFAQRVAERMRERAPELIVTQMRRALRPGKVFIDWSQNDPHKTTVSV